MVTNYRELVVWQKAMDLVTEVYRIAKLLPREELYALSHDGAGHLQEGILEYALVRFFPGADLFVKPSHAIPSSLARDQRFVNAVQRHKFVVGPTLDHLAALHDDDLVTVAYG